MFGHTGCQLGQAITVARNYRAHREGINNSMPRSEGVTPMVEPHTVRDDLARESDPLYVDDVTGSSQVSGSQ